MNYFFSQCGSFHISTGPGRAVADRPESGPRISIVEFKLPLIFKKTVFDVSAASNVHVALYIKILQNTHIFHFFKNL